MVAVYAHSVYALVEYASALGTAGILITTVAGLYTRVGGPKTAAATLGAGLVMPPIFEHGLQLEAPFITTLLACAFTYIVLGSWESRHAVAAP